MKTNNYLFLYFSLILMGCATTPIKKSTKLLKKINKTIESTATPVVIKTEKPFFKDATAAPIGYNKSWSKIDELSDEFETGIFDDTKWHKEPTTDGFSWIGRPPGLFEANNVTVSNGNLNITTLKYQAPKKVRNLTYTHGGGIVRSKKAGGIGMYYECKMKANKTIMSSTFWLAMKQNCKGEDPRKLELDIQECVGRVHQGTKAWAKNWDAIFHSNAIIHARPQCGTPKSSRGQNKLDLTEKNYERFHVYGFWWKSPTDLRFYLDGEYKYSITPTTDFTIEGFITMAVEVYDWNPVDPEGSIFETASFDDLTTKYDWIRTWKIKE